MDSGFLPTAAVLAVICIGFVIAAKTRLRKQLEGESRATRSAATETVPPPPPERSDATPIGNRLPPTHRWAVTIAVISFVASAGLGFAVYNQGEKLHNAEATLDKKVDEAEERLSAVVAAAVGKKPDVDAIKRDLDDLEWKLFGISGGGLRRDIIGSLEADVASAKRSVSSLGFDLSSFKSCMNRALSSSLDSYARAAGSYYSGTYYVSKCY